MPYKDPEKRCTGCNKVYPFTLIAKYFAQDKSRKTGFHSRCKACHKQYYEADKNNILENKKKYYKDNKIIIIEKVTQYYSNNKDEICKKRKQTRENNPEKICKRSKVYYEKNRERLLEKSKNYRTKHPEKFNVYRQKKLARKRNALINDLTPKQWAVIKAAYNYRCVYCRPNCWRCQRKKHALTQDHITPLSKGGNNTMNNIVPACHSCNSKKHTGPPLKPVQPLLL